MKHSYYNILFFIFAIILNVYAKMTPSTPLTHDPSYEDVVLEDAGYLVVVDRENKQSVIDAIHNLIMENKDTYKDVEKFKQKQKDFEKERETYVFDYGDSAYVFEISHVRDTSMLYAYLSTDLVAKVSALPHVQSCSPDKKAKIE